jgi:Na+-translocating ferredoxin:NAD+ oxidoreductase RnfA subunit
MLLEHILIGKNSTHIYTHILMIIDLNQKYSFIELSTKSLHPIMYSIMGYFLYLLNIQQAEQLKVILQLQETNALQQHKIVELTASISRLREIIEA